MIDWDQIRQLEEDVGAEDLEEVVNLFLSEVDEAVDSIATAPPSDQSELAAALHFLKGSAYNLGFKDFGAYCAEGEKLAQDALGQDFDTSKIPVLYQQSKEVFKTEASKECSLSFA